MPVAEGARGQAPPQRQSCNISSLDSKMYVDQCVRLVRSRRPVKGFFSSKWCQACTFHGPDHVIEV